MLQPDRSFYFAGETAKVYRAIGRKRSGFYQYDKILNKMRRKMHFFLSGKNDMIKKVEKYTKIYSGEEEFL